MNPCTLDLGTKPLRSHDHEPRTSGCERCQHDQAAS